MSATSGNFLIDPDGPLLGHEPFMVFCNFSAGIRYGTTFTYLTAKFYTTLIQHKP